MREDTITAISTPLGEGGIGIVRLSGSNAINIADKIIETHKGKKLQDFKSHSIVYGKIIDSNKNKVIDEALISIMRAPKTYTKENIVEINCHGGIIPIKKTLDLALENGARLAEPGEFTKRAFLNGRLDLSQAEAVIDLIRSKTEKGLDTAVNQLKGGLSSNVKELRRELLEVIARIEANIDFSEEDIEEITMEEIENKITLVKEKIMELIDTSDAGKILREGLKTIIAGKPNVGKSSLLNALLREKRAIVTEIPGTTRDVIEEIVNIKGVPLKIMDTAGIRDTDNLVEKIGVQKSKELFNQSDLILFVLDAAEEITKEDKEIFNIIKDKKAIILINKTDLPNKLDEKEIVEKAKHPVIKISVKDNIGIDSLEEMVYNMFFKGEIISQDNTIITNSRHKDSLKKSQKSLEEAMKTIKNGLSFDFISIDLKEAWEGLGEITGETVNEDILDKIFSEFCIGK